MKASSGGLLFFLFLSFLSSACMPCKKATIAATASVLEDVLKASYRQSDLRMIREGTPAYLMLLDGMIEAWPDNAQLLIAAAQGYSSFASVFWEDQDRDYAKQLTAKGKRYALRALELKGLKDPLQRPFDDFKKDLKILGKREVPSLFWSATCWASWINLNLDSVEAVAELPRVEVLMQRVLDLDEAFYYGGPHLFMGIWFASRPKIAGGDLQRAQRHFIKAIELGHGKFLMAYVYYANTYARQALDKDLFISLLQRVLELPADDPPELTLLNTVAKKNAQELLRRVQEYFDEETTK
ncbi:MAG: TRAP transporter TatT component family protein [Thermodesulfobacteriota bacterium]